MQVTWHRQKKGICMARNALRLLKTVTKRNKEECSKFIVIIMDSTEPPQCECECVLGGGGGQGPMPNSTLSMPEWFLIWTVLLFHQFLQTLDMKCPVDHICRPKMWAQADLNQRPSAYQPSTFTTRPKHPDCCPAPTFITIALSLFCTAAVFATTRTSAQSATPLRSGTGQSGNATWTGWLWTASTCPWPSLVRRPSSRGWVSLCVSGRCGCLWQMWVSLWVSGGCGSLCVWRMWVSLCVWRMWVSLCVSGGCGSLCASLADVGLSVCLWRMWVSSTREYLPSSLIWVQGSWAGNSADQG